MPARRDLVEATKCQKGLHAWTDENTKLKRGKWGIQRHCRACYNATQREYRKKRRDLANADVRKAKAKARERGLGPDDPRHGTSNGYSYWGCWCEECTAAENARKRLARLKAKARKAGLSEKEIEMIVGSRRGKGYINAIGGFADTGGYMDQAMDPVFDAVLERVG